MNDAFDVIVVGVGAVGASACAALAARGARVLGLERFSIPHEKGSSAGDTRLFRTAYFEHPDYVPLLRRARQGWRELEERTGVTLFHETGLLYAGPPDGPLISGTEAAAGKHGVQLERVGDPRTRHPQFALPPTFRALFEPEAGVVLCARAIEAFARTAVAAGAEIRTGETVLSWAEEAGGVQVRTAAGACTARHLVLAAGAWTAALSPRFAGSLRVTQQVLGWIRPADPRRFAPEVFPSWAIEDPDDGVYYGFPLLEAASSDPARRGIKVGRHVPGPAIEVTLAGDPRDEPADGGGVGSRARKPGEPPDEGGEGAFRPGVERYLPSAAGPTTAMVACKYTMSPDGQFLVGRLPGSERVSVACGFSGHGFKFAPVIGEALADLAVAGRTTLPIGFLDPSRFLKGTSTPAAAR